MAEEGFKRKLTAILSADVIGYSRLMRDNEEATVRDLAAHRVLITEIIQQHNGRVVDSPGDNILKEWMHIIWRHQKNRLEMRWANIHNGWMKTAEL